ncbi:helix-turn-helix domain-containing protein [Amycolatopsis australiensis]|uniref:WD40 repeat n=1 Tax=Amycolatopsis australiensis TaxID=546364 RepID=A0A1K1T694_9PSEU|nr:helix-turn-helix domain-containing protein [Amycolatopsis australiensis]SFW92088.1 WD40 repeat [Amycolatopsis australiensis]
MARLQAVFAADLDQLRRHAGLSIAELAGRAGLSSSTVGDLLRGGWVRVPPWERVSSLVGVCVAALPPGTRAEETRRLGELKWWKEQHADLVRRLASRAPEPGSRTAARPVPRCEDDPRTVERPELGAWLLAALTAGQPAPVVLVGAGGFGKTTVASWACARLQQHFRDGVYWFRLGSATNESVVIGQLCDAVAVLTGRRPERASSVAGATEAFAAALGDRKMLLVIDGVRNRADLAPFLVGGPRCVRLVTTRRTGLVRGRERVVDAMTEAEARALLCRDVDASAEPPVSLLDRVGRWPLALSLLNGVLISLLRRRLPPALAFRELDAALTRSGVALLDELTDTDSGPGVAATLRLSFDELVATSPCGAASLERYLMLAAFPERLPVPYGLLSALWGLDTVSMTSECDRFFRHSLLAELTGDGVRLHDVIRDHLRRTHPERVREASRRLLDAVRPPDGWHRAGSAVRQQLAHHLIGAGAADELAALCVDLRHLARRVDADGVHAAEADVSACLATQEDDAELATLLRILRSYGHLLHGTDSALSLYCHLSGRVAVTHVDEALPAWSLRPVEPLPECGSSALLRSLAGHRGQVSSVQWLADGTLATVGGDDGTLRVWNAETGRARPAVDVSEHLVLRARLSPDGRWLAQLLHEHPLAGRGHPGTKPEWVLRTVVTDTRDGSVLAVDHLHWLDMFLNGVADLHWNEDSTQLAVAGGGRLRVWRPQAEPSTAPTRTHDIPVYALSWHPDAGLVAISDHALYVWADPASPDPPRQIEYRPAYAEMTMRSVAWSPDGRLIAVGMDFAVAVLNAATGRPVLVKYVQSACDTVSSLAWRPDGELLAIAGNGGYWGGGLVALTDLAPDAPIVVADIRTAAVTDLAWSTDGGVLAAASVDSTVRLFGNDAIDRIEPLSGNVARPPEPPPGVVFRPLPSGALVSGTTATEDTLVVTSADGLLAVEACTAEGFSWVMSSAQACTDYGVLPHAARKVFGRPDERLELRTVPDRALVAEIVWPKPRALAVNPDRTVMVTTTEDGRITAYELSTFRPLCTVVLEEPAVACWFSESGDRFTVEGNRNTYAFEVRVSRRG